MRGSLSALLAFTAIAGCDVGAVAPGADGRSDQGGTPPVSVPTDGGWNEWTVLGAIADGTYREQGFVLLSSAPYPSELTDLRIEVWVSQTGESEYLQVEPSSSPAGLQLPVGTVIVRALVTDAGAIDSLTVMARGPSGYSAGHGDIMYGSLHPDGLPMFDVEHVPMIGPLVDECTSCHDDRSGQAFVFGVPTQYRRAGLAAQAP